MKSELTKLSRVCKVFAKKHDSVKDIILFGSIMRGKEKPSDIDIMIVFIDSVNKSIEYELKQQLEKNVSLISKTEKSYILESFDAREGILFEGFSLINNKPICSDFGFIAFGNFLYDTSKLNNTTKTRFYYALNGRNGSQGVASTLKAIKISDNNILVPVSQIETAKEFFDYWGIEYKYIPTLIPERLARASILAKDR